MFIPQQPYPMQAPPVAYQQPARRTVPPSQPAPPPPARFPTAIAQAPEARPITYRGTMADHGEAPPAAPIVLPSPAQLGLVRIQNAPREPGIDWDSTRQRLKDLRAVNFGFDQLPEGGSRFVCNLATTELGGMHRIEAQAATEAEAVRQALAKAEYWRRNN
jgi:hypothetical protein